MRLGVREAKGDWLELGRDLTSRGLAAPRLVVADGAPGLISAVEELWPRADRQHCAVHRLRNLLAKLPKSEHDRVRRAIMLLLGGGPCRRYCRLPPPHRDGLLTTLAGRGIGGRTL